MKIELPMLFLLVLCALMQTTYSSTNVSTNLGSLLIANSLMPDILSKDIADIAITPTCKKELLQFQHDFYAKEEWPLKMLEASARIPNGLFRGSRWWIGIPEDCRNIKIILPSGEFINGKYGILQLSTVNATNLNTFPRSTIYAGLCFPSGCIDSDVYTLMTRVPSPVIKQLNFISLTFTFGQIQLMIMDPLTQFMIFFCGLILTLTILGTLLDCISNLRSPADKSEIPLNHVPKPIFSASGRLEKVEQFLSCFSFYCNGKEFFNSDNSEKFTCIYGIRFFSMVWIMLHHTMKYIAEFDHLNTTVMSPTIWGVLFSKGDIAVSVFFVLSSMMMTYNLFQRDATKKQGFIWWKFYARRLWRLSPVYYFCFLLSITILLFFGQGIFWPPAIISSCRRVWCWHFLYLNNIFSSDTLTSCWSHSWYLCVEVQLFFLSPLILMALIRSQKFGLTIIIITMLSCWIFASSWMFIQGDNVTNIRSGFPLIFLVIFTKPIVYAPSYLIGILLGYILFKTKSQPVIKTKWFYIIIWIIVIFVSYLILIGGGGKHFTFKRNLFYTLHRSLWSLGTAMGIYCCLVGYGGWINHFLSMKIWIPFSRLTYCAYLIHIYAAEIYIKNQPTQITFSSLHSMAAILMILILTCLISFIITLTFEIPLYKLERLLTKRLKSTK